MTTKEYLESVLSIPFEISPIDNMHFSVLKSDLTKDYNEKTITEILNRKFPWAMAFEWTPTRVKFTLA